MGPGYRGVDVQLPAVSRFLAETAGVGSADAALQPGGPSEVTAILTSHLSGPSSPVKLPKAVEAYYRGPGTRGYSPPDADARYIVPPNKPPKHHHPHPHTYDEADDPSDFDPYLGSPAADSHQHRHPTARAVVPGSAPLAVGPPLHSTVQTGHLAASLHTPSGPVSLDWAGRLGTASSTVVSSEPLTAAAAAKAARASRAAAAGTAASATPPSSPETTLFGSLRKSPASGAPGREVISSPMPGLARSTSFAASIAPSIAASTVVSRRTNAAAAALPQTPEGKFCGAVMGVMERLAASTAPPPVKLRTQRVLQAEQRAAVVTSVELPAPPQTGSFSSKAAAGRMAEVLQRSGASRGDMAALVEQIPQLASLSEDLRSAVADQFCLFVYPPGSYLYEQDCSCDEMFVLLSGCVMLHPAGGAARGAGAPGPGGPGTSLGGGGAAPQRLQPGSVLGVDLMLRRAPVPVTVTTDPHFEAQLAVLSWQQYEDTVRRWAAAKVAALLPDLQASQLVRLRAGLVRGVAYAQRQAGEPLYVGGRPVDHIALLVKGQVLMAAPWGENTLVTEGQMVSQLRVLLGPVADTMVLNELPRAAALTRGGLKGGLRASMRASMRGSVRGSDSGVSRAGASFAIRDPGDREGLGAAGVGGTSRRTRLAVAVEDGKEEGEREGGRAARRVGVEGGADAPAVVLPKRGPRVAVPSDEDGGKETEEKREEEGGNRRTYKEGRAGVAVSERVSPRLRLGGGQAAAAAAAAPEEEGQPHGRAERQNGEQRRQSDSAGEAPVSRGSGSGSGAGPGSSGSQQQRRARSGTSSGRNSRKGTDPGVPLSAAAVDGGAEDAQGGQEEGGAGEEGGGVVGELEPQHADAPASEVAAASRAARVSMTFTGEDVSAAAGGSEGSPFSFPGAVGPEDGGRQQGDGEDPVYEGDSPAGRMPSLSFIPHAHDLTEADGSEPALSTRASISGTSFAFANPGGAQSSHGFAEAPLTPMLIRLPFMPPPPVPDQGWDAPPAADPDPILLSHRDLSASSTPELPEAPAPSVDAPVAVSTPGVTPPSSPPLPPRSLISKIAGEKSHSFGKHATGSGSRGPSPPASGSSTPTAASRAAAAAAKARDSGSGSGGHPPPRHSDGLKDSQQSKPETPSPGGSEPPSLSHTQEGARLPRPTPPAADPGPAKSPSPRFPILEGSGDSDSVASAGPSTRDNSLLDVGGLAGPRGGGGAGKQPSRLRMRLAVSTPEEEDEGDKNEASGKVEGSKGPAVNRVAPVAGFPGRVHVAGGAGGGSRLSTPGGGGALGGGGMQPLANALSAQLKFHKQRVAAVFSAPVLFGQEALQEDADARPLTAHTAISMVRSEFVLVPVALLRALLPPGALARLAAATAGAQRKLVQAAGAGVDDKASNATWPANADRLRAILASTQPGQRQPWQVEALAAGFSALPEFAKLTWQVRLRLFQDAEYRQLPPGAELHLARMEVTEVHPPPQQASSRAASPAHPASQPPASRSQAASPVPSGPGSGAAAAAPAAAGAAMEGSAGQLVGAGASASSVASSGVASSAAVPGSARARAAAEVHIARGEVAVSTAVAPAPARESSAGIVDPRQPSAEVSAATDGTAPVPVAVQGAAQEAPGAAAPGQADAIPSGLGPQTQGDLGPPGSAPIVRDAEACDPQSPQTVGEGGPASATGEPLVEGVQTGGSGPGSVLREQEQEQLQQPLEPSTGEVGDPGASAPAPSPDPTADPIAAAAATDPAAAGSVSSPAGPSPGPTAASPTGTAMSPDGSPRKRELRFGRNANKRYTPSPTRTSPSPEPPADLLPPPAQPSTDGTPQAPGDAALAAAAAAASPSPRPGARLSTTGAPHTAEALFNPAAEEPLIPSLALHRRGSAAEPEPLPHGFSPRPPSPPTQQDSQQEGQRTSEASADGSRPGTVMTVASSEPPSVMPSPHVTLTRGDAQPAGVSPLYAGYVISDDAGAAEVAAHLLSEAADAQAVQQPPQPPLEQQEDKAPAPEEPVTEKVLEQPQGERAPSPPPQPPPQLEALTFRLDDKMYWCISGELWLEAAPQPSEPSLSEQPSEEASSRMDIGTDGGAGNGGGAPLLSAPPPAAGPTGSRLAPGALSGLSLALPPRSESQGNVGSDDGSSVGRGWPGSSRRTPEAGSGGKGAVGLGSSVGLGLGLQLGYKLETEDGLFVAGRQQQQQQQQRDSVRQQRSDMQEQHDQDQDEQQQEQQHLLHLLPPPMQLQVVNLGGSFHSAMLCETATAGLQQQDGPAAAAAAIPSEESSDVAPPPPPPPVGTSVLRARAAADDGAEVLSMSKPMLELLVGGMGRSMAPEAFQGLARHVDWLAAVDLRALTLGLAGRYRMEEHRRGTELLRAGEAAPAIFIVASGECVMRGPVVGLKDPASAPGSGLDLALLHEGSSCGELSLVAGRPLWYSMVVSSPTARVVCIDIGALRSWLLGSPAGNAVASDVVAAVVEHDVALYGRAVKQIAVQVLCEKLDLSLFTAPMKAIIQRVIEDNNAELNAVIHAQDRDAASRAAAKAAAANGTSSGAAGTATAKDALSASSRPRPVVLEGWDQVEAIAASTARPYEPQAQSWELIEQARYNAHRRQQQRYLSELHTASQLASEEHPASGHAAGDQRIAMPAPGPLAAGLAEPGAVRQPKVHDVRTTPKELRGTEVDHARSVASSAFLPQHQLVAMMGATVHIQQAAVRQLAAATAAAAAASADMPVTDGGSNVVGAHGSTRRLEDASGDLAGGTCVSSVGSVASSNVVGASSSLLARNGGKRNGRQGQAQGQAGGGRNGAAEGREATHEASFAGVAELGAGAGPGDGGCQAGDGPDGEAMGPSGGSVVTGTGTVAPVMSLAAQGQQGLQQQAGTQGRASGWSRGSTPAGALHGRLRLATPPIQADTVVALSARPTQRDGSSPGRLQPNGTASPNPNPLLTARKRLGAAAAAASAGGDSPGRCPRPVVMLSQAPSSASIMLDPALRAELDRQAEIDEMLEEAAEAAAAAAAAAAGDGTTGAWSAGPGSTSSFSRGSSAGAGGGGGFAPPVGALGSSGFQGFSAPTTQPWGRSPLGPGGGALALAPLPWPGLQQGGEQQQQEGPANRHHSTGPGLARSLDLGPGRGLAGLGAGLGLSSSVDATAVVGGSGSSPGGSGAAKVLPPLPAPHDPLGRSVQAAWQAGHGGTGGPGPGPATHGSSPRASSAPAGGGTGLGGCPVAAEAAGSESAGGLTNRSNDSVESGASAGTWRRSRMQPTAAGRGKGAGSVAAGAGEGVEEEEAPDRVFWVRDRLHDPQGLALNVMANAAAQAVAQTLTAGPAPPPLGAAPPDTEASQQAGPGLSSASPSANVLMTTGGRSAIPAVSSNGRGAARLQPLQMKRNAAAAALGASGRLGARAGSRRPGSGGGSAGGGPAASSAGDLVAAAPQAQELGEQGMLFVTLEVPPAPKLLPEFPSPAALREAAEAEAAAREAARQARIAAALSHASTRPLAVRPDMGYVPRYLQQRQRQPLVAPPVRQLLDGDAEGSSWVVPAYSSEIGFQEGFYDEDTQVVYFD